MRIVIIALGLIAAGALLAGAAAAPIRPAGGRPALPPVLPPLANCAVTTTGFIPLIDLGTGTYHGYEGGLYGGGSNTPSAAYLQVGEARAKAIQPRLADGTPDRVNGRLVLLSLGMSNTTMEFSQFVTAANQDPLKNPQLVIVDGAVGGQDAEIIKNPASSYWITVTQRLTTAGVAAPQVQAVWLKEAIAGENEAFPTDARHLESDLRAIVAIVQQRFPNVQIVYLASRTYAGYATTTLNPEPYAYQSGFAVQWLISDGQKSTTLGSLPWLAWGPYLWTDGLVGRSDGLTWACTDVQSDGTHPSASGVQKVVNLLLPFFKTDPTAAPWFTHP
ncbi:MAG TPA: hypothetical protein VKY74_00210 [Chloroflexia bacterium]|nr:hypothetical protein [Chloroflexia bacterium]